MKPRIAALVFDLDGTLVDSLGGITAAINEALAEIGRPAVTGEAVRGFVGDGPRNLCLRAFVGSVSSNPSRRRTRRSASPSVVAAPRNTPGIPSGPRLGRLASRHAGSVRDCCSRSEATGEAPRDPHDEVIGRLLLRFRALYAAAPVRGTVPYAGVPALLDDLGGRPWAICTNKGRPVAELVLRHFGLDRRCRLLVADGDLPWRKPDPRPILHAVERLGAAPAETLVVGDGLQDLGAAAAAGCPSCGLLQGYGGEAELRAAAPTWLLRRIDELPDRLRAEAP